MENLLLSTIDIKEIQLLIESTIRNVFNEESNSLVIKEASKNVYLTVEETAKFLSLSPSTIYRKIRTHQLPFIKPPDSRRVYFKKEDLHELLNRSRYSKKCNESNPILRKQSMNEYML